MDVRAQADGQRNGWSRPVALPVDIDAVGRLTEKGLVHLPLHVFWSGPDRMWDLDDKRQRAQVYELVLTEGTEEDVRRFIDVDELVRLWPDLWLPAYVRKAWSAHLRSLRGIDLAC